MKPKIWRVLLSLLLLFLTACGPESPLTRSADDDDPEPVMDIPPKHTGKKIALVIGNWAYKFKPLNNPKNDARDMAQLLRKPSLGFKVIHKENLSFEEMQDEVIQFKVELIKRGQVGLFYFAGHGLETVGNVWEWTCSEYENKYSSKEEKCTSKNRARPLVIRLASLPVIAQN